MMQSFCCRTPRTADSPEIWNHYTDTPQLAQKVQKVQSNVIENVFVVLNFWKYETRKQTYIVSGFTFRALYVWKYNKVQISSR